MDKEERIYQLHRHGSSYCITIPKPLVKDEMIKNGVHIIPEEYSDRELILKLVVADERGKHPKNSEANRKHAQKSGASDSIQ